MTNRQKYITKKNEHDMMMDIRKNTDHCPIHAVSGKAIVPNRYGVGCITKIENCSSCINDWLNKKEN